MSRMFTFRNCDKESKTTLKGKLYSTTRDLVKKERINMNSYIVSKWETGTKSYEESKTEKEQKVEKKIENKKTIAKQSAKAFWCRDFTIKA